MARVWQVTLDRLRDTPLAGRILAVLAWWAPEGVPRRLLGPLGSPLEVTEAVRRLRAHSMITLEGDVIAVHRVVQAVVRAGGEGREEAGALLVDAVGRPQSPDEVRANFGPWQSVAAQAEALARCTEPDEDTGEWARLFDWAGLVFGMAVDERSFFLCARALLAYMRLYGMKDDRVLRAMRGVTLGSRHGDGSPALAAVHLAFHSNLYGPDDPRTIDARTRLAEVLLESSRGRAEKLLRENVDRAVRSLGEDAPATLDTRRALIAARSDPRTAVSDLESLVARAKHVLPEGNALIRTIEMSLISVLVDAGRTGQALDLAEEAAEDARRRFGDAHLDTLVRRGFHAVIAREAGEVERARALARELLSDCQTTLGEVGLTSTMRQLAHERLPSAD